MEQISNNTLLKTATSLRIAFFIASSMIFVGIVGTFFVNTYFLILPALVAGGLLFSSSVGWCPMVYFIEKVLR